VHRYLQGGETSHIVLVAPEKPALTQEHGTTPPPPLPAHDVPPPARPDSRQKRLLPPLFVASGIAVTTGVATIIFGVKTLNDRTDWDNATTPDDTLKTQGEQHRLLTNIMLGTMIVSGITATVLCSVYFRKNAPRHAPVIAVAPGTGPGILLKGQF
ncbi:MAG: hypothetical protein JXX14_15090, partial [Deltaproteobacteria bacterium]|nr:hypothetical protein [Deltaproteobacteria bacterium]